MKLGLLPLVFALGAGVASAAPLKCSINYYPDHSDAKSIQFLPNGEEVLLRTVDGVKYQVSCGSHGMYFDCVYSSRSDEGKGYWSNITSLDVDSQATFVNWQHQDFTLHCGPK